MLLAAVGALTVVLAWSYIAVALITFGVAVLIMGSSVGAGALLVAGVAMFLIAMRSRIRGALTELRWRQELKAAGFDYAGRTLIHTSERWTFGRGGRNVHEYEDETGRKAEVYADLEADLADVQPGDIHWLEPKSVSADEYRVIQERLTRAAAVER
jgi:hypothetical protein